MPRAREILLSVHVSGKTPTSVGSGFDPVDQNSKREMKWLNSKQHVDHYGLQHIQSFGFGKA